MSNWLLIHIAKIHNPIIIIMIKITKINLMITKKILTQRLRDFNFLI